ncbi:MAG: PDZ domain-containing protein [Gemmatimonadales bacterium]|jgi:serine protease Do|nr:MAG: PDZ domain-containing protein [Gemmatimonadales bacterium]
MTSRHNHARSAPRRARVGVRAGVVGGLLVACMAPALSAQSALDTSRRTAIVAAVERLAPAVVSISVAARQRVAVRSSWADMFVPRYASQLVRGSGTGFLIRGNGVILTNQHVVAGAEQITVTLVDGTQLPATLVGGDPVSDIAVIQVKGRGLPTVPLGKSSELMVGEWVVALGNPYADYLGNTEPTVTAGVVSATGRNILPSEGQAGLYLDMIQTDAAINPGNSGGPLANALGQVVGVNSSILSNSGGSIGLGFAIPIERALRVADLLLAVGAVRRAWTGLDVTPPRNFETWRASNGLVVVSVAPGGPAARAGIQPQDVLVSANGRTLHNHLDWESVKLDLGVGDTVILVTRRGTTRATRALLASDLPTRNAARVTVLEDLQLVTVTPAIRAERGVQSDQGALVVSIAPRTADATGLREGDVIIGLDRRRVATATDLSVFLDDLRPGESFRIWVERNGQTAYTDLVYR